MHCQTLGTPGKPTDAVGSGVRNNARLFLIVLALIVLVAAVYWPVGGYPFVSFDDGRYVFDNPQVREGLTKRGFVWAFTTVHASNWHPLTWLSHMVDVEFFGLDAGWHHRVNVLWHGLNTVILFLVLQGATGEAWPSAFVSALFAAHPLHVESVAWIAERKDVLSTFFWLLTMAAYLVYMRRPSAGRYLCVTAFFGLGLLSKPMVVTLPVVLLLFDLWPLGRVSTAPDFPSSILKLLQEKLPLLAMAALTSAMTYIAQSRGGTVSTLEGVTLLSRVENALISYVSYIGKMFWPASLAVFYPHPALTPTGIPGWRVVSSVVALAGITALVAWQWRRRPFLAVGWLWYLVTLLPVIGVIQVGLQGMADRYTYVPSIGIFVALAWLLPSWVEATRAQRYVSAAVVSMLVLGAAAEARVQIGFWRDNFTLFEHAAKVTKDNWLAWKNLGVEQFQRGQYLQATESFRESLRVRPFDADTWVNLGLSYAIVDQHNAAAQCFRNALRYRPDDPDAWFNLGIARAFQKQPEQAKEALERLRQMDPNRARELMERLDEIQGRP